MQKKHETPTISRRSFLKGMAAGAVGVATMGILGCGDPADTTTAGTTKAPESTNAPETQAPEPTVTPIAEPDVSKYEVIDSDLIIVGAGWAAISAAFQAIALGQRVTIIEKTPYRHGGAAGYNWDLYIPYLKSRDIAMMSAQVSTDKSKNNKAAYKCYKTDPFFNLATTQLQRGEVLPRRNPDGTQAWYVDLPTSGYFEGSYARTGQDILSSNPLVTIYDRTMVTNLLINDGKCVGAVGLYLPTGDVRVFRAKATITATGASTAFIGWTGVCAYSINGMDNTSDVDMAAYRLGCGIGHSESSGSDFCSSWPTGLGFGWSQMINPDSLEPDTYADRNGEHIFDKERDAEIIAMGAVDRSIFNSHVAKFLADPKHATDEGGLMGNLQGAHLRHFVQMNLMQFEKFGIDPMKEMLPIHDEQYERGGQPVIDENLMSEIPGLFCARGAGTTGVSMGGTIATYNIPFGAYATRCAVDYIKKMDPITSIDFTPVEEEYARLHEIRTRKVDGGIRPFAVRHQIQHSCGTCCGLLREKEKLEACLAELKRIREEELPRQIIADQSQQFNTDWKEAIENYNLLDAAELMVKASLLREESTHSTYYRPDFPEAGGEDWNCMLVGKWTPEGPEFTKKQFELLS